MGAYREFHRRSHRRSRGLLARRGAARSTGTRRSTRVARRSRPPFARGSSAGDTNLCHNAVDRHLAERGDQKALIYISTETGEERALHLRASCTPR